MDYSVGVDYSIEKMRFVTKGDKSAIRFNNDITISGIPLEAYDYVINGRSAQTRPK
jgi:predicted helicase